MARHEKQLSYHEFELIRTFRKLDERGKNAVEGMANCQLKLSRQEHRENIIAFPTPPCGYAPKVGE